MRLQAQTSVPESGFGRSGLAVPFWLEMWQLRNRIRLTLRRPGLLMFYGLIVLGVAYFLFGSGGHRAMASSLTPAQWAHAMAFPLGLMSVTLTLSSLFRGLKECPLQVQEADPYLLYPTPMAPRTVLAYHILRNLTVSFLFTLPAALFVFGLLTNLGGEALARSGTLVWSILGFLGALWFISAWSMLAGTVIWVALRGRGHTEQAARWARGLRAVLTAVLVGTLAWLAEPILAVLGKGGGAAGAAAGSHGSMLALLSQGLGATVQRSQSILSFPPLSWLADLLQATVGPGLPVWGAAGAGWLPALAGSLGLTALLVLVALALGRDFYEPAAASAAKVSAVMRTVRNDFAMDATGALAAIQGRRIRRVQIPTLGNGPWALLWAQLLRYVRLEIAVLPLYFLVLVLPLGGGAGLLIREHVLPAWSAVVLPLLLAGAGSGTYFTEELQRPQLFTVPGPAWQRLLATNITGVLDMAVTGSLMLGLAGAVGNVNIALILLMWAWLLASIALAQTAGVLVTELLPVWVGQTTQQLARMAAAAGALGAVAVLVVMLVLRLGWSLAGAMGAGAGAGLALTVLLGSAATGLFGRLEMQ